MATRRPTKRHGGLCGFCGQEYAGSGMARHVIACKQRPRGDVPLVQLTVSSAGWRGFWLTILAPTRATLADVDAVLRDEWLECCGHLSAFTVGGVRYIHGPFARLGPSQRSMDVSLAIALPTGSTFQYEYDFGSTTALVGRSATAHGASMPDGPEVVARNLLPVLPCDACGAPATRIYTWRGGDLLCDGCFDEGDYDEEGTLPVVNSPRMGVCAYIG